jgi:hypothetical protein
VTTFSRTEPFAVPAAELWAIIGNPADDSWTPLTITVEGSGEGAVRTVHMPDGPVLERCERLDHDAMAFGYELLSEAAIPVREYHGLQVVRPTGAASCQLEWSSTYTTDDPAGAEDGLDRLFRGTFKALHRHLGDQPPA